MDDGDDRSGTHSTKTSATCNTDDHQADHFYGVKREEQKRHNIKVGEGTDHCLVRQTCAVVVVRASKIGFVVLDQKATFFPCSLPIHLVFPP